MKHDTKSLSRIAPKDGILPEEAIVGDTIDLSEYIDFNFYDPVWYWNSQSGEKGEALPGRWLGISHRQNIMRDCDTYYKKFPWKQTLIEQPLEGAAVYISKGQIVCSKRVPRGFEPEFCHPYYRSVMKLHSSNLKGNPKLWGKQAKLVKHMYFHR